jgi:hypothetical protein
LIKENGANIKFNDGNKIACACTNQQRLKCAASTAAECDSLRSLKIILRDKIGESIYIHQPRLIASQKSGSQKKQLLFAPHTEAFNSLDAQK